MDIVANIATWFLVFITFSVIGWAVEVLRNIILFHKFSNRGFLIGPLCPIYGCAGVIMSLILQDVHDVVIIFCVAMVSSGVVEYLVSYIMEKLFHVRWWDYSHRHFNIEGRVCLGNLVFFGLLGMFVISVINPILFGFFNSIPEQTRTIIAGVLLLLVILDLAISLWLIIGCRVTVGTVEPDATDEISKHIREVLMDKSKLNRRLVKAFPAMVAKKHSSNKPKTKPKIEKLPK